MDYVVIAIAVVRVCIVVEVITELLALIHDSYLWCFAFTTVSVEVDGELAREALIDGTARVKRLPLRKGAPTTLAFCQILLGYVSQIESKLGSDVREVPKKVSKLLSEPLLEHSVGLAVPKVFFVLAEQLTRLTRQAGQRNRASVLVDTRIAVRLRRPVLVSPKVHRYPPYSRGRRS